MERITIIVVDDHPLFRQGVLNTLGLEPDFSICGQASNGEAGLALLREKQPFVAVVDINLPLMNGQQIVRQVIAEKIPTRVILMTAYDDEEQKTHAMRSGAAAYCTKDLEPERLIALIRKVAAGGMAIGEVDMTPAQIQRWLDLRQQGALRTYSDPGDPYAPLSAREMEVLSCLTKGLNNKQIASQLGISHQTVKNHVTTIFRKLCVNDRTQAAVTALKHGWVRLQPEHVEPED